MRPVALVFCLSFTVAGCSAKEPAPKRPPGFVKMRTEFDSAEHEPYARPGANAINGRALLTRQGGGVVTCAGGRVLLMPATPYFREMFWHMIVAGSEPEPPENPNPKLKGMIKRAECDAEGNFSFAKIADGTWFLLTQIDAEGQHLLIAETAVADGRTIEVLLSDKHVVGR